MATIHRAIDIEATADAVWAKISDTARISELISFISRSEQTGDDRICTMEGGGILNEQIVTVDPTAKRVVYAITASPLNMAFHAASMQVEERGRGSRLVWTIDLLPAEVVEHFEPMIDVACGDMKSSLAS